MNIAKYPGVEVETYVDERGVPAARAYFSVHSIALLDETDRGDVSRVPYRAAHEAMRHAGLLASLTLHHDPLAFLRAGDGVDPQSDGERPGVVVRIDRQPRGGLVTIEWEGGGQLTVSGTQFASEFESGNWRLP